jgi:hypothetical protein
MTGSYMWQRPVAAVTAGRGSRQVGPCQTGWCGCKCYSDWRHTCTPPLLLLLLLLLLLGLLLIPIATPTTLTLDQCTDSVQQAGAHDGCTSLLHNCTPTPRPLEKKLTRARCLCGFYRHQGRAGEGPGTPRPLARGHVRA